MWPKDMDEEALYFTVTPVNFGNFLNSVSLLSYAFLRIWLGFTPLIWRRIDKVAVSCPHQALIAGTCRYFPPIGLFVTLLISGSEEYLLRANFFIYFFKFLLAHIYAYSTFSNLCFSHKLINALWYILGFQISFLQIHILLTPSFISSIYRFS